MRVLLIADDKSQTSYDVAKAKAKDLCALIMHGKDEILLERPKTKVALSIFMSKADSYDCVFIELPRKSTGGYSSVVNSDPFTQKLSTTTVPVIVLCQDDLGAAKKLTKERNHALIVRENNIFDSIRVVYASDWITDHREANAKIAGNLGYLIRPHHPLLSKKSTAPQSHLNNGIGEPKL